MRSLDKTVLETFDLEIGYKTKGKLKAVAKHIHLKLNRGQLTCLLGPNGAGKSTLIKTLCGLLPPIQGYINLCNDDLSKLPPHEIALYLSLVLTDRVETEISVYDVVALGRAPYTDWRGKLSDQDRERIRWGIQLTGIEKFIHQKINELSDGERQKVMIARALTQDTALIILDEPTAHLDLPNRVEVFRLLRTLAHQTNKGILLSTHELDLALQAADTIWMMQPGESLRTGVPEDLVINGTFESVFQREGLDFNKSTGAFQFHPKGIHPVELIGSGSLTFWTQKALERKGFCISTLFNSEFKIEVLENKNGKHCWVSSLGGEYKTHYSIAELMYTLEHTAKKAEQGTIKKAY